MDILNMKNTMHPTAVIFFCVILNCGIFTPRDSFELPVTTPVDTPDYFNFGRLLRNTEYTFTRLDWYELFHDNLEYTVIRTSSTDRFSQLELINWLLQQHDIYPAVTVTWVRNTEPDDELDTLFLNDVSYTIVDPKDPDVVLFQGDSRFKIIRGNDKIWRILKWTDSPVGTPFFAPEQ
jgi:hypothetical protein